MKKIPDYNGRYEITEDGRIWSNFSGRFLNEQINHHTKLTLKQIREILPRIDGKYGTLSKLAREYNVSPSLLSLIGHGYRTII